MGDEPSTVPTKFITGDGEGGRWSSSPRWELNLTELKFLAILTLPKKNRFTSNERFNRFTTDQGTKRFTANTAVDSYTNTSITSAKRLVNRRKNNGFITDHNTERVTNSFSTNRLTRRTIILTTRYFT